MDDFGVPPFQEMLEFAVTWHVTPATVALFHSSCADTAQGHPNRPIRGYWEKEPNLAATAALVVTYSVKPFIVAELPGLSQVS